MLRKALLRNLKISRVDMNKLVKQQVNQYHVTHRAENTLILGGLGLAATGIILQYGLNFYRSLPKAGDPAATAAEPKGEDASTNTQQTKTQANTAEGQDAKTSTGEEAGSGFFSSFFSKGYYEGGFEEKMSKREAALILGVRESASLERIKDAHRKILLLNHPDRGGSALLAAKINEAKDLLSKGKV